MCATAAMFLSLNVPAILAQSGGGFDLSWSTIDSGGITFSSGGTFTLGATAAQADAGPVPAMSGGAFSLTGGFWPAAAPTCSLLGDMDLNATRNGLDIQDFVNCLLGVNGTKCSCADISGNGSVGV